MKSTFIIIIVVILFASCGQFISHKSTNKTNLVYNGQIKFDSSNTAFIPLAKTPSNIFDTTYQSATLTASELTIADSLLIESVTAYNSQKPASDKYFIINLASNRYKRQIVAVINGRGEKEVWINCLCATSSDHWKTYIERVLDGGSCYFNLKINLATKRFYNFGVNGVA